MTATGTAVDYGTLVARALGDDDRAWRDLRVALEPHVLRALSLYFLDAGERDDVFAMVFFRLYEALETIEKPTTLPAWMRTATRNEVYALSRARRRFHQAATAVAATTPAGSLDEDLMEVDELDERAALRAAMREALRDLPERDQELLALLSMDPAPSYTEISMKLDIPVGSIGPTYGRIRKRLARHPVLLRYRAAVKS